MIKKYFRRIGVACFFVGLLSSTAALADGNENYLLPNQNSFNNLNTDQISDSTIWSTAEDDDVITMENGYVFLSNKLYNKNLKFTDNNNNERNLSFKREINFDFEDDNLSKEIATLSGGDGLVDNESGKYCSASKENGTELTLDNVSKGGVISIEFDAMKSISEAADLINLTDSEDNIISSIELRRRKSTQFYLKNTDGSEYKSFENYLIDIDTWFNVALKVDFYNNTMTVIVNNGEFTETTALCTDNKNCSVAKITYEQNIDNLRIYNGSEIDENDLSLSIDCPDEFVLPQEGKRNSIPTKYILNYKEISGEVNNGIKVTANYSKFNKDKDICIKNQECDEDVINARINLADSIINTQKQVHFINGEIPSGEECKDFLIEKVAINENTKFKTGDNVKYTLNTYNGSDKDKNLNVILCLYNNNKCEEIDVRDIKIPASSYENIIDFEYNIKKSELNDLTAKVYVIEQNGFFDLQ